MITVTNVTLFFRNYGNKCICSIYSYQNVIYIRATSPKSEYQGRKCPSALRFSQNMANEISISFPSSPFLHTILDFQYSPFLGKVAVNRTFAVKLIPREFYPLDQWNFNPKKKIFFLKPLKGILSISKHDARSIHSSLSNLRHAL